MQQAEVEDAWYMDGETQLIAIISDIPAGAGKVKDGGWFGEGKGKEKQKEQPDYVDLNWKMTEMFAQYKISCGDMSK